jgi:hypothetical protein
MTGSFVIFIINTSNFEVLRVDLYAQASCKHCNFYQRSTSNKRDVSQDSRVLAVGEVFSSLLNVYLSQYSFCFSKSDHLKVAKVAEFILVYSVSDFK